ncbi:MAG: alpha-L-rhamnosidase, partial [Bacteroidetes bacterium]|nr:alpha-L-rhamnosidase [Bacteroidota bacterium]
MLLVLVWACNPNQTSADNDKPSQAQTENEIVRSYLSPENILWRSEAGLLNEDNLLQASNGQADLVGARMCTMGGTDGEAPSLLLDFGQELHGGIEVVTGAFEGKQPIRIQITLGESASEAMSSAELSTATNDHAIRDFTLPLPWMGKVEIGNSGFRFVRITLLDTDRTLLLKSVRAISIYRDIEWKGSFRSSDPRLDEIWQVGARTVHLNMQEYLWDGIKRDRLVWVGDMHPEVMTILSVFGYNEVVPKSLDLVRELTPLPDWMNGISSYSMWWILIHHQWYINNGDLDYLKANQEYIFQLLDVLKTKININGIEELDGHRFLDWPNSENPKAVHAGLQSMMAMTFRAGSDIARFLDRPDLADSYQESIDRLLMHVPDPNGSKSGGALMALSGLVDHQEINQYLLSADPLSGISTFYGYYVLQARAMAGDYQGAMDVIRDYWGAMLDLGATTFWEDFDLEWAKNAGRIDELPSEMTDDIHADYGAYCYVGLRHSLCHGWASGPTAWLSEHVLGIQVVEPGCSLVRISPQ